MSWRESTPGGRYRWSSFALCLLGWAVAGPASAQRPVQVGLFMNTLDTVAAVRRHVAFYFAAHNGEVPHSAFGGQTPDEMYFGTGDDIPAQLEEEKRSAREARLDANRAVTCGTCSGALPSAALSAA